MWTSYNFIDYLNIENTEIKNLPAGISISTMCTSCKLNTKIDIVNIEKYLPLSTDDILTVKRNTDRMRTLIESKPKPKRIKKIEKKKVTTNHFYNQITIVVRVGQGDYDDLTTVPKINMKIFKNGSVQMSGCKSITNINIALNKLIFRLKEIKARMEDGKIIEKAFIEEPNEITIKAFKIDMINSNYKVNMQLNRYKLYELLIKKKIKSTYEPSIRACVIIKYTPLEDNLEQKEISVFIFQKGNIIITGARSKSHILQAYNYMNNILLVHKDEIIKNDEEEDSDMILDIYSNIMEDIKIGLIKV
jgi:TATA-box binding protein (TBP) (component of TFIID and TFIIIB)/ribosomal protein L44E